MCETTHLCEYLTTTTAKTPQEHNNYSHFKSTHTFLPLVTEGSTSVHGSSTTQQKVKCCSQDTRIHFEHPLLTYSRICCLQRWIWGKTDLMEGRQGFLYFSLPTFMHVLHTHSEGNIDRSGWVFLFSLPFPPRYSCFIFTKGSVIFFPKYKKAGCTFVFPFLSSLFFFQKRSLLRIYFIRPCSIMCVCVFLPVYFPSHSLS